MRKQSMTHAQFLAIEDTIEARVSRAEIDRLIEIAVARIRLACRNREAAFAWSGGKDSIALAHVCRLAGIEECVFAMTNLEYPAFLQWVTDHMPERLEVINVGLDLDWLAQNSHMLFPQDAATAGKWFSLVQHKAQDLYFKRRAMDILLLGRRREDGNFVGRNGQDMYEKAGVIRFSPLANWTHAHVIALIHYYALPMPPFYRWPRGYRCGTHPWAARQWCASIRHGFQEVYAIDPSIVEEAAAYLPQARTFLSCVDYSDS